MPTNLGNKIDNSVIPSKEETENFWKPIFEERKDYRKNTSWLNRYSDSLDIAESPFNEVTIQDVKNSIRRFNKWKAPGNDKIQAYWWTVFSSSHENLTKIFNYLLEPKQNS